MRSKKVFSTVMAVILVTSQVAWAQGDSPGANRNYNNNNQSQNTYDRDQRRNDRERGDYRNNYRGSNRGDYRDNNRGDYRGDYRDNYRYYGQPQHGERAAASPMQTPRRSMQKSMPALAARRRSCSPTWWASRAWWRPLASCTSCS